MFVLSIDYYTHISVIKMCCCRVDVVVSQVDERFVFIHHHSQKLPFMDQNMYVQYKSPLVQRPAFAAAGSRQILCI